jgi:hypothetical protein
VDDTLGEIGTDDTLLDSRELAQSISEVVIVRDSCHHPASRQPS